MADPRPCAKARGQGQKNQNNKAKTSKSTFGHETIHEIEEDGMTGIIVSPDSNLKRSEFNLIDIDLDNALGLDTFGPISAKNTTNFEKAKALNQNNSNFYYSNKSTLEQG